MNDIIDAQWTYAGGQKSSYRADIQYLSKLEKFFNRKRR